MSEEVEGMQRLIKKLRTFPERVQKNVLRTAIYRGAQAVRDSAKANAASMGVRDTGALIKSIKARRSRGARDEVVSKVEVGKFYARFVELGFLHKGGEHVAARPFMRTAVEQNREKIVDTVQKGIREEIEKKLGGPIQG